MPKNVLSSDGLRVADPASRWTPLAVSEVRRLFSRAPFPWWIAGGWAIDLFIGRQTRPHADTDVLLLRQDQLAAQALLAHRGGWQLFAADPPGVLRLWMMGEWLPVAVH